MSTLRAFRLQTLLLLALAACGAAPSSAPAPTTASPEPSTQGTPMQPTIHREGDESPEWAAAIDVTLAQFANAIEKVGATEQLGRVLVVDGAVVQPYGGMEAVQTYLASIGFPKNQVSRQFLCYLLAYHTAVDRKWIRYPMWEWSELDESFRLDGNQPPILTFPDDSSAVLSLQRTFTLGDRVWEDRELQLRFSPAAEVTFRRFVGFGDQQRPVEAFTNP
ncbi:MAG: hypothetical protein JRI25_19040 [Deltaproteobacteria bacterium]|nr:hypothetical protein [Deltaproteobacteria bacterium]